MNTAKIIAVTQPLLHNGGDIIYDESGLEIGYADGLKLTVDEFIAYVARVSNPSNQMNTETAPKLLRYLAKHKHWSPFEMVNIVMEIETTRDIARQILRHRSFSFQEFSQRYADPTQDLGFVWRDARLQDLKNRQNSIETDDEELQKQWIIKQGLLINEVDNVYKWAVQNGIAKEQARAVLPEGLTNSRMYMNGTLRSWIHYCQLRMGPETQKEHREVATDAWYQITEKFPSLKDALDI
jgi:thymidylate synthase (FAD)